MTSGWPIFGIFQISALADKFFCLADAFEETFILTVLRTAAPWAHGVHILPLAVLSNMGRSLSNNQIELLNKELKCKQNV